MLTGVLQVTSVDPVSGEELASGELTMAGVRAALPFRATRGECVQTKSPELAARIAERLRALDAEHGAPVRARFDIANDLETFVSAERATLPALALVRVLVQRVADARLTKTDALGRIAPADLAACGSHVLDATTEKPVAHGLAASGGAAVGRLATPKDVETATDGEPRVLVIDDASPEDAAAIRACVAILATSGGLTADAAIAARALRKPCVVSTPLRLSDPGSPGLGDWVTVDGTKGDVYAGVLATTWTPSTPHAADLVSWLAREGNESPAETLLRLRNAAAQGSTG